METIRPWKQMSLWTKSERGIPFPQVFGEAACWWVTQTELVAYRLSGTTHSFSASLCPVERRIHIHRQRTLKTPD